MILIPDDEIQSFCHRWKVAVWCLFDLVEMKEELTNIFGREVDLIEKEALRNPFRRHAILYNREIIWT